MIFDISARVVEDRTRLKRIIVNSCVVSQQSCKVMGETSLGYLIYLKSVL